jgi:hypothetical protein
MTLNCLL